MDDDMLLAGVLAKCTTSGGCPFGEILERNSRSAGPEDLGKGQFGVPGGAQRGVPLPVARVARNRIYGGLPLYIHYMKIICYLPLKVTLLYMLHPVISKRLGWACHPQAAHSRALAAANSPPTGGGFILKF